MRTLEEKIEQALIEALKYYPEISRNNIIISYNSLKNTSMAMRPMLYSLFLPKTKWRFVLFINSRPNETGRLNFLTVSPEVILGILGHELAHIIQYRSKSRIGIIILGLQYVLSIKYRSIFEREADYIAIARGVQKELFESRQEQLRTDTGLSSEYLKQIKDVYLSPEEIQQGN